MSKDTHTTKGAGLARGPALVVGALLAAFGLILFLKIGDTPTGTFPDGTQNGPSFLGFETNGWTAWFTTAAGALLLFGAAQHLMAKTMSLVIGLALGACSVIAIVDGDDVLGLAAANGPVKLGWGVAAAVLLFNTLAPRRKHHDDDLDDDDDVSSRPRRRFATRTAEPGTRTERVSERGTRRSAGGSIDPDDPRVVGR